MSAPVRPELRRWLEIYGYELEERELIIEHAELHHWSDEAIQHLVKAGAILQPAPLDELKRIADSFSASDE